MRLIFLRIIVLGHKKPCTFFILEFTNKRNTCEQHDRVPRAKPHIVTHSESNIKYYTKIRTNASRAHRIIVICILLCGLIHSYWLRPRPTIKRSQKSVAHFFVYTFQWEMRVLCVRILAVIYVSVKRDSVMD